MAPDPDSNESLGDLPLITREFLRSITSEEILNFKNMVKLYESLDDRPKVLKWLQTAREEDIELLDDGLNLVRSGRTIGKFTRYMVVTLIAAVLLGSQFGEAIAKILAWVRGGK